MFHDQSKTSKFVTLVAPFAKA